VAVTSSQDDLDGAAGASCGLSSDHHFVRTFRGRNMPGPITRLPTEQLDLIFHHVRHNCVQELSDLISCMLVCKAWKASQLLFVRRR
jgi:hypothetical protein